MTFNELYVSLLNKAVRGESMDESGAEAGQLDFLLHPELHAPVWATMPCGSCLQSEPACRAACLFGAISKDKDGKISIDPARCSGCSACISACHSGALTASRDILPTLNAIKQAKGPVYALIAPSFHGQFSKDVTPGKLRTAFMTLGFTGMTEVALFADILTLKESLAFRQYIGSENDFLLTSCCCPVWIAMIRKLYIQLLPHVPATVSPMIAAGRVIKALHPNALTIFIGPCIAKKAEARDPELVGAVDWVLTYREIEEVFKAAGIRPEELEADDKDHSSRLGRVYGRSGGVSEAVGNTVGRLAPDGTYSVKAKQASGIDACKALIKELESSITDANFFEGMGCEGGCVGGPYAILDRDEGRNNIEYYAQEAVYGTPLDNPYVLELINKLGYNDIEELLSHSDIFSRDFKER